MTVQKNVLVVGATGATGRLLVAELLRRGQQVRAIVRNPGTLPEALRTNERLALVHADLLNLTNTELAGHVKGCDAVASCLGHTPNIKGVFGPPYRLVTDATRRLCVAIQSIKPDVPIRYVLMNSAGCGNRDLQESVSFAHRLVIGLLRVLVPPHADNERAANHLRTEIGRQTDAIKWVVVRPDGLTNEEKVTPYELHPSPTRSAIFDAGETSRINVAHFMASLVTEDEPWTRWAGRMPVIYNKNGC